MKKGVLRPYYYSFKGKFSTSFGTIFPANNLQCDDSMCRIEAGEIAHMKLLCSDIEINDQCYSLSMKEILLKCKNSGLVAKYQTVQNDVETRNNVVQVDNLMKIQCSECPGMYILKSLVLGNAIFEYFHLCETLYNFY